MPLRRIDQHVEGPHEVLALSPRSVGSRKAELNRDFRRKPQVARPIGRTPDASRSAMQGRVLKSPLGPRGAPARDEWAGPVGEPASQPSHARTREPPRLGRAVGGGGHGVHARVLTVLHQHMPQVGQASLLPPRLVKQARLEICRGPVRLIRLPLTEEVAPSHSESALRPRLHSPAQASISVPSTAKYSSER